jgi:lipopolysaccharide assembly protein A
MTMNIITTILTALILAIWVSAIAILSVQNATLISLQFLSLKSIEIPIGIILGFSASLGMIGGAICYATLRDRGIFL